MNTHTLRLTSLAHGGGCGCKLAPSVLQELLADQPATALYKQLLVGTETSDDAAVWQVDDNTCIIATTDFFMPMVDDPYDFGRIAATNAISDVYAMGGKPIMALAILGMPVGKIPTEMVREILKGGASVCADGRHPGRRRPFDRLPRAGLWPGGDRHLPSERGPPQRRRPAGRRPDPDQAGRRRHLLGRHQAERPAAGRLPGDDHRHHDPEPDRRGARQEQGVHAMTDVTGFGVLGHTLELARGSKLSVVIEADKVPLLADAAMLAEKGFVTGASHRNWASYGESVALPSGLPEWKRHLLADPQTSGGLLVSCAPAERGSDRRDDQGGGLPCRRALSAAPKRARRRSPSSRFGRPDRDLRRESFSHSLNISLLHAQICDVASWKPASPATNLWQRYG